MWNHACASLFTFPKSRKQSYNASLSGDNRNNFTSDCAVYIRGLSKKFRNGTEVIKDLSMNVKQGTIYSLLGASGCGKTTLLTCLAGLEKWDRGTVFVLGKTPRTDGSGIPGKKIGYMPQEMSLYQHLTSKEMLQLYGRLFKMPASEIEKIYLFLETLLELPSSQKRISQLSHPGIDVCTPYENSNGYGYIKPQTGSFAFHNLTNSGGQKRRVSLALAMVHNPELLILDEPTVGLDPLLRRIAANQEEAQQ